MNNNKEFEDKLQKMLLEDTPNVLDKIKESPRFQIAKKERKSFLRFIPKPRLSYAFSSIFVLGLLIFTILLSQPSQQNNVIASTITIDINPSISIELNSDDEVVNVSAINQDAVAFIDDVNFKGLTIDQTIETIIERAIDRGFIVDDNSSILVNVISDNESKRVEVRTKLEQAFENESNRHSQQFMIRDMILDSTPADKQEAREHKMSVAKYELIQDILALSSTYSFDELASESIRSLFDLLEEYNGDETNFPPMGPPDDMPGRGNDSRMND